MAPPKRVSLFDNCNVDEGTGCWNWTGAAHPFGYGTIQYDGRTERVHRVAMHVFRRFALRSELNVLHHCDNTSCFNPQHLFVGTQRDNMLDKTAKGRHHEGKKTHCIKGHPFSGENLYIYPSGYRHCKTCTRESDRKYRESKRGTANPS